MSDKAAPATTYTGPGSATQGPVSSAEQGIGSEIYQLVLKDVIERSEFGARKYGHALRVTANVDFDVNAYQEILDLLIYMRAGIEERSAIRAVLYSAFRLIEAALLNSEEVNATTWEVAARNFITRYTELVNGASLRSECGSPYPCEHVLDGGRHPEVPAQGA